MQSVVSYDNIIYIIIYSGVYFNFFVACARCKDAGKENNNNGEEPVCTKGWNIEETQTTPTKCHRKGPVYQVHSYYSSSAASKRSKLHTWYILHSAVCNQY